MTHNILHLKFNWERNCIFLPKALKLCILFLFLFFFSSGLFRLLLYFGSELNRRCCRKQQLQVVTETYQTNMQGEDRGDEQNNTHKFRIWLLWMTVNCQRFSFLSLINSSYFWSGIKWEFLLKLPIRSPIFRHKSAVQISHINTKIIPTKVCNCCHFWQH